MAIRTCASRVGSPAPGSGRQACRGWEPCLLSDGSSRRAENGLSDSPSRQARLDGLPVGVLGHDQEEA